MTRRTCLLLLRNVSHEDEEREEPASLKNGGLDGVSD